MDNSNPSGEVMSFEGIIQHYFEEREAGHGWFAIPRGLLVMVQDGYISKSEYILISLLLHLENWYQKHGEWFFHSDDAICSTKLLSHRTLSDARTELHKIGLIDFKKGYSHHSTEYLILIPQQYYVKREDSLENSSE